MREILFRGKTAFGAWVHGDLIHRQVWKSKFKVIRSDDNGFDNYTEYEVATQTIGQYTGLTDKNGKKIFEGDILKAIAGNPVGEPIVAKVVPNLNDYELMWDIEHSYELEIIGNIHDNPELLEGGAKKDGGNGDG